MNVIDYQTTIAWRCPQCGKLELKTINIFNFSGGNRIEIKCPCGFPKVKIGKKENNDYWLEYFCNLCESQQVTVYSKYDFWAPQVKSIKCTTHKIELGYLGNYQEMNNLVTEEEEYLQEAREKLKINDYPLPEDIATVSSNNSDQNSLRKLKKIKILEGVVKALRQPSLKK